MEFYSSLPAYGGLGRPSRHAISVRLPALVTWKCLFSAHSLEVRLKLEDEWTQEGLALMSSIRPGPPGGDARDAPGALDVAAASQGEEHESAGWVCRLLAPSCCRRGLLAHARTRQVLAQSYFRAVRAWVLAAGILGRATLRPTLRWVKKRLLSRMMTKSDVLQGATERDDMMMARLKTFSIPAVGMGAPSCASPPPGRHRACATGNRFRGQRRMSM